MDQPVACSNCAMPLEHEYCGHCGQRRFRPEHRRLAHLLGQFFGALTDLDSRAWRSLRALAFQPGRLTRDWFAGRRAYWMSPIALFLLANLVFFLAPAITDFDLPLHDHVSAAVRHEFADPALQPQSLRAPSGQPHSSFTEGWVRARLQARAAERRAQDLDASPAATFEALAQDYARASASYSKLLIVLHVPFLALGLQLMMLGSRRYFAEHMAAALHFFAFVLFFVEAVVLPTELLGGVLGLRGEMPGWIKSLVGALLLVHTCRMLRVGYGNTRLRALLAGIVLPLLLLVVNVTVYRGLQFVLLFALA